MRPPLLACIVATSGLFIFCSPERSHGIQPPVLRPPDSVSTKSRLKSIGEQTEQAANSKPCPCNKGSHAIHSPPPAFPTTSIAMGIQGEVKVRLPMDAEGEVIHVEILQSVSPRFRRPTLDALQEWKYEKPVLQPGQETSYVDVLLRL